MREQLTQYVSLMFAGTQNCEDIELEILQNTLDRYDDLIAQGKSPEAAYRLAIIGIGDITEILFPQSSIPVPASTVQEKDTVSPRKRRNRALAIGMYIICIIPLIILSDFGLDTLGLCLTLLIAAAATVLLLINDNSNPRHQADTEKKMLTPHEELKKGICSIIGVVGLIAYFVLSFSTGAWHITWVVFPLMGAVKGLARAILDLKEAVNNES